MAQKNLATGYTITIILSVVIIIVAISMIPDIKRVDDINMIYYCTLLALGIVIWSFHYIYREELAARKLQKRNKKIDELSSHFD